MYKCDWFSSCDVWSHLCFLRKLNKSLLNKSPMPNIVPSLFNAASLISQIIRTCWGVRQRNRGKPSSHISAKANLGSICCAIGSQLLPKRMQPMTSLITGRHRLPRQRIHLSFAYTFKASVIGDWCFVTNYVFQSCLEYSQQTLRLADNFRLCLH